MRSILIITEQFTLGGLETHIQSEVYFLRRKGFDVHLATGEQFSEMLLPQGVSSLTTGLNFGSSINIRQMIYLVNQIRKIVKDKSIDIIHAHPFNSLIPGLLAAEAERLPFILTLHGPLSVSGYGGAIYDLILKSIVLPHASITVCVSDEIASIANPYVPADRLRIIPNGVDFSHPLECSSSDVDFDPRWCVVSRLDSFKVNGIYDFVLKAKNLGIPGVVVVGDGPAKEDFRLRLIADDLAEFVEFYGPSVRAPSLMQIYAGVAGMGRVVLEAIAHRKKTILIGYDGVKGVMTLSLFEKARLANFSGRGLKNINVNELENQLAAVSESDSNQLHSLSQIEFDQDVVWGSFIENFKGILPVEESILGDAFALLKVNDENENCSAFESNQLFDALVGLSCSLKHFSPQMTAAISRCQEIISGEKFRREGMEPLGNFEKKEVSMTEPIKLSNSGDGSSVMELRQEVRDLRGVISDLRNSRLKLHQNLESVTERVDELNMEVRRRDGEIESLNILVSERSLEVAELSLSLSNTQAELHNQKKWVNDMLQSKSWRLTKPLRASVEFPRIMARYSYGAVRQLFFKLPAPLRRQLESPASQFSKYARDSIALEEAQPGDLNWDQFNGQVLSRRVRYKGIFIQELVIDWNVPLYQRPQHMAVALAKLGYLVIYRTDNWASDNVNGFREVVDDVWITNSMEVDRIDDVIRSVYSTAYANSKEKLLKNGRRGTLIYEYIDHIDPEISGEPENIKRLLDLKEFAFSGGADYIVASAQRLYDEAVQAVGAQHVILVPNGVDTGHYRSESHQKTILPKSLTDFRKRYKNIVGYFGALAPWLWYEVIDELISKRPDLGFVFIGPDYYNGAASLPQADNVLYLGSVDYKILPAYAMNFDVCFIPFKPGEIAKTTSPLKLFEYFALEKPVVVTSEMLECIRYPEVFHGDSANSLECAIEKALQAKNNKSYKRKMASLADANDWSKRASALDSALSGKV